MPVAQSGCIEVPVSVVPEITSKKAFNPLYSLHAGVPATRNEQ